MNAGGVQMGIEELSIWSKDFWEKNSVGFVLMSFELHAKQLWFDPWAECKWNEDAKIANGGSRAEVVKVSGSELKVTKVLRWVFNGNFSPW